MAPIRKPDGTSCSSSKDSTTMKPAKGEQRRKRLRIERDSDEDVQILEDEEVSMPAGRTNQKCADAGREKTKRNSEASGKRARSDSFKNSDHNKAEQKGKGKNVAFKLSILLLTVLGEF